MSLLENIYCRLCLNKKYINFLRTKGIEIGDDCNIARNVNFGSEPYLIKLGNKVRVTSNVKFITHDGGCWVVRNYDSSYKKCDLIEPIIVGNNVHIGINSILMPGVHIGNNVIIGCGSIVTRDIPDNSVAAGVPCRVIRSLDDYINKHQKDFLQTKHLSAVEKKKFLIDKFNV